MAAENYYITAIHKSLHWAFAKPAATEEGALRAAVNSVIAALCDEHGIERPRSQFEYWWRREYPEFEAAARAHIGETRRVSNPDGLAPKAYQRWFCNLTLDEKGELLHAEAWV